MKLHESTRARCKQQHTVPGTPGARTGPQCTELDLFNSPSWAHEGTGAPGGKWLASGHMVGPRRRGSSVYCLSCSLGTGMTIKLVNMVKTISRGGTQWALGVASPTILVLLCLCPGWLHPTWPCDSLLIFSGFVGFPPPLCAPGPPPVSLSLCLSSPSSALSLAL